MNATNAEHIQLAFDKSRASGLPLMVLGNGSNLLLADSDLEALVLRVSSDYTELSLKMICLSRQRSKAFETR